MKVALRGHIMSAFTILDLTPYSTWRHVKTDSRYTVIGLALCSTNGQREHKEQSVIYVSHTHQHLCYREVSEFLDGRFVPVELPYSDGEV